MERKENSAASPLGLSAQADREGLGTRADKGDMY